MNDEKVSRERKQDEELLIFYLRHRHELRGNHTDIDRLIREIVKRLGRKDYK